MQLTTYLAFQSKALYRIKGLVWLTGEDHRFILQSIVKSFDLAPTRKWDLGEKKKGNFVLIGKQLKRKGIERILSSCLVRKTSKVH